MSLCAWPLKLYSSWANNVYLYWPFFFIRNRVQQLIMQQSSQCFTILKRCAWQEQSALSFTQDTLSLQIKMHLLSTRAHTFFLIVFVHTMKKALNCNIDMVRSELEGSSESKYICPSYCRKASWTSLSHGYRMICWFHNELHGRQI